jgi:hypothetical protein
MYIEHNSSDRMDDKEFEKELERMAKNSEKVVFNGSIFFLHSKL